jgi:hypothetical protein
MPLTATDAPKTRSLTLRLSDRVLGWADPSPGAAPVIIAGAPEM